MTAHATDVVIGLGSARKAVQLYPPAHPAFGEAMDMLITAVDGATAEGPFVLNLHLGRLYDGSLVIPEDIHGIDSVAETFESLGIESLTFSHGFSQTDAQGLIEVLALKSRPGLDVMVELTSRNVHAVTVQFLARGDESEGTPQERTRREDRAMHSRLVNTVRNMSAQLTGGGVADLSQTTPIVEGMLDRMMEDQAAVIGMATIRSKDERVLYHSLSVMIYTLALGQELKLPDDGLLRLATAALLHDIGKSVFDADDPIQAEVSIKLHPRVGAEILQRLVLDDPGPMLVAFEHHIAPDGSGFPERPADYIAHPYSRMVAVADRYENLTNPHTGVPPLTPDRAVVRVLQEAGTLLDPFFARAFVAALGVFPIGCVVRLSDQTVGVVCRPGDDPLAPVVKLTYDERGMEFSEGPEIDLAQGFVRIVEIVPAEALNLEVSDAL
ncbi:MAG: HD domain-containing protein [Coriobacteriia bacterium]|nr:HD domain-containing protein [Coriobacteriia bacterium]